MLAELVFSEGVEEKSVPCLYPVSGSVWQSVARVCITPISAPLFTCCSLCVSLSSPFFFKAFYFYFLKKIIYLFILRERGRAGEREGEKHQCVGASPTPSTGDLACNPGTCPDWESNRQPFCLVCRPALNPLSHTRQDSLLFL